MASSPHMMFQALAQAPAKVRWAVALLRMETSWETTLTRTIVSHGFVMDRRTGTFTTFDAPGAGTGPSQGTYPFGINAAGAISGWYVDASDVNHGFVRDRHGAIVEFDVPGAGTGPFQGPNVYSICSEWGGGRILLRLGLCGSRLRARSGMVAR